MENSRSSTPEAPPENLWSSILDSVSTSRALPSKQILLLGQPSTGKSTIASALLQRSASQEENREDKRVDFAIGYEFADVRDDGDEDTLARLSVYTIPSSDSSYTALLPHFLPPRTALPHSLAMIMLDWTRPWSFIEELQTWLRWVERWVKGDGSRELEVIREECRERLQSHLQHYSEPSTDTLPASSSALNNTILPLGPGNLTHNAAGVPIIVVCSKADLIDEENDMVPGATGMSGMVKGKGGEWEERTDGVMQVLRTICLKYGASLFYTTPQPTTLQVLRQHALHLLFMPPPPSPIIGGGPEAQAPIRNPFPFQHKPNTLDRDHIMVPVGWDSWGKIAVLREGFDAKSWGEAWERDLEETDGQGTGSGEAGAKKLFAMLVPDQGERPHVLPPINNPIPEQTFLLKHYDENSKKPDRDPRASFRNPADLTTGAPAGIVGPLGSSSFSMPHVERVLNDLENSTISPSTSVNPAVDPRKFPNRPPGRPTGIAGLNVPTNAPPSNRVLNPSNPGSATSPTGGPQPQHEVLHNFFQSLLSSRDRVGGRDRNAVTTQSPARTNGQTEDTNT
ncbi:Cytoplasmic dynein 1 light intermediate chain 1 [Leucoagaricus sp. SymC.cos]|nr:Cytoplasmic dynein 1 light intermediate chain 1 [Leucoagaricus sp. SymC.cos]